MYTFNGKNLSIDQELLNDFRYVTGKDLDDQDCLLYLYNHLQERDPDYYGEELIKDPDIMRFYEDVSDDEITKIILHGIKTDISVGL